MSATRRQTPAVDGGVMYAEAAPIAAPVLFALLLILAWSAVPLGSNRPWSSALLAAMILGLAFWQLVLRLWRQAPPAEPASPTRLPAILLIAYALFSLLQTVPVPMEVLRILSPTAHAIWIASGVNDWAPLSLDRGQSLARGLHFSSLAALFVLGVVALSSWQRLRIAAATIVAIGSVQALFGISVALGRSAGWLLDGPVEGVGGISGTFVNPNHFAGFIEMSLCVSIGMVLVERGAQLSFLGLREFVTSATHVALSARLPLFAAQLLMVVALMWSGSRGAMLALFVALTLSFLVLIPALVRGSDRGRRGQQFAVHAKILGSALAVVVLALAWGGPGVIAEKFSAQGISGNRVELSMASAAMASDFALTGAGAGSFKSVFPGYKTAALGLREYEHAHNDYLETVADSGLVGALLFFGAIATALAGTVRRARARRSREGRALSAGCVAACLSLLVHALFDFNLQIPANASLFVFVLAMGLSASTLPRNQP